MLVYSKYLITKKIAEQSKVIRCMVNSPHHSPLVAYLAAGMLMAFLGGMGYMYWKNSSRKSTTNPNAYKEFSNPNDIGGNFDEFDNNMYIEKIGQERVYPTLVKNETWDEE